MYLRNEKQTWKVRIATLGRCESVHFRRLKIDKATNENEEYKTVRIIEGYDIWAPTYDKEHNPLIAIEASITLDLARAHTRANKTLK